MALSAQLPAHEQDAVAVYFDGDAEFYRVFRASAVLQFPVDLREGDAAVQAGDVQALRRAAHTLKGSSANLGAIKLRDAALGLLGRAWAVATAPPLVGATLPALSR